MDLLSLGVTGSFLDYKKKFLSVTTFFTTLHHLEAISHLYMFLKE